MKTKNKTFLLFGALYVNLVVCIAGSIFGTYAWYQYSSRAGVTYDGTAVGANAAVELGLYSDFSLGDFASKYNLQLDTTSIEGGYVYWSTGELSSEMIQEYETKLGYSGTQVGPTSSGKFNDGEEFKLMKSPVYLLNEEFYDANPHTYSFFHLVFRLNGGTSLYLEKSDLECDNSIGQAMRIFFHNPFQKNSSFIFNPCSYVDGYTDVGGILDLNRDGFYDFINGSEKLYGEYINTRIQDKYDGPEDAIPQDSLTTFTANHRKNIRTWEFEPLQAHYFGTSSVLSNKPLSTLRSGDTLIRLDTTIYLEGWDLSCIDLETEVSYDLNLSFITK